VEIKCQLDATDGFFIADLTFEIKVFHPEVFVQ